MIREKTCGNEDYIELSTRLRKTLARIRPDIFPAGMLAFKTPGGARIAYRNFRMRVWDPIVIEAFDESSVYRRLTPHCLRHTWATGPGWHSDRVGAEDGWTSSRMLLDVYGHFMPREMRGFADKLAPEDGTQPRLRSRELRK